MPNIQILLNDISHALTDLNPRKAYGPNGVPLLFSKNLLLGSTLAWSNFSVSANQLPPNLLAGSMPTYNLFPKRVTVPIPQFIVLLL